MNKGCDKQCLVDGEIHIQCGSFYDDNPKKGLFLCHECLRNDVKREDGEVKKNG